MSSVNASITLVEICHPDNASKVLRSWGQVVVNPGGYVSGGIPMNLFAYLDQRTCDVNGFLRCSVWDEEVQTAGLYQYHYSPVNDSLQIFTPGGTELASGAAVPIVDTPVNPDQPMTQTEGNLLLFCVEVDRTCVRG